MNSAYNTKELVNILYRSGMDFKLIKKLIKNDEVDQCKNSIPGIAKVSKKRGRGCILIVTFKDGSIRELDFYNLRTSDTDVEIVKLLNTRGYLAQFQYDDNHIFWDKTFSIDVFEIFEKGKIIYDPVIEKARQKAENAVIGRK